jgi:two-component sensor histidine kinase
MSPSGGIEQEKSELLRQTEELLRQKDVLLRELEHRVANSLQIIEHLDPEGAHCDLRGNPPPSAGRASTRYGASGRAGASSRIRAARPDRGRSLPVEAMRKPCGLDVTAGRSHCTFWSNGGTAESAKAVSLGLIVTHAFPMDTQDGRVVVSYEIDGADWKLAVSDNGIGKPDSAAASAKGGLGTVLVKALARGPRCKGRSRHRPKWCERVAHARDLHLAATPNSLTAPKALFAMMVEGQT